MERSEEKAGNPSEISKGAFGEKKLIEVIQDRARRKELFYSIEVTPSDPPLNLDSLQPPPLFASITWISDKNLVAFRKDPQFCPALQWMKVLREKLPVLSHLTCLNMTPEDLEGIVEVGDLKSILALQGGNVSGPAPARFEHAVDLVRWLRQRLPDATIGVAGYPHTHFLALSPLDDLHRLREKVEAGADFIITQITFSSSDFIGFVRKCRFLKITCPMLPGVFIPPTFESLLFVTKISRIPVEEELWEKFKNKKDDLEAFQEFSLNEAEKWMKEVLAECPEDVFGFHIFTWK
uniref:Uncharacterized protein n=1 Tax=Phlebotomus papatasi TaxID=29031 RepID=A0A1B0DJC5_PHLPP